MNPVPLCSFILCSWKAPAILDEALQAIFSQHQGPFFEVILVNNGFSSARSRELAGRFPGMIQVEEATPGLAHARIAGFRVARGEFLVCLDDDNIIGPNFVHHLSKLLESFPNAGGICPAVVPRWEKCPPKWLQDFGTCCLSYNTPFLNQKAFEEKIWKFPDLAGCAWPPGGGMILHRSLAEGYIQSKQQGKRTSLGRNRSSLGGSEDQDIFGQLPFQRRDAAFSSALIVYHVIPKSRCRYSYLLKLNFRMCQDWAVLDRLWRRENHPWAVQSTRWHLIQCLRLPGQWFLGRMGVAQCLLQWARHAGYLWGWFFDRVKSYS